MHAHARALGGVNDLQLLDAQEDEPAFSPLISAAHHRPPFPAPAAPPPTPRGVAVGRGAGPAGMLVYSPLLGAHAFLLYALPPHSLGPWPPCDNGPHPCMLQYPDTPLPPAYPVPRQLDINTTSCYHSHSARPRAASGQQRARAQVQVLGRAAKTHARRRHYLPLRTPRSGTCSA